MADGTNAAVAGSLQVAAQFLHLLGQSGKVSGLSLSMLSGTSSLRAELGFGWLVPLLRAGSLEQRAVAGCPPPCL